MMSSQRKMYSTLGKNRFFSGVPIIFRTVFGFWIFMFMFLGAFGSSQHVTTSLKDTFRASDKIAVENSPFENFLAKSEFFGTNDQILPRQNFLSRNIRSPFRPPIATSSKKPIRKASNSSLVFEKPTKISKGPITPPNVQSQRVNPEPQGGKSTRKNIGKKAEIKKVLSSNHPPSLVPKKAPVKKTRKEQLHIMPFQQALEMPLRDKPLDKARDEILPKMKNIEKTDFNKLIDLEGEFILTNALSKDLKSIENFLSFVKDESDRKNLAERINSFLNSKKIEQSLEDNKTAFQKRRKFSKNPKKKLKMFEEFPFTEIVHNLTVKPEVKFKDFLQLRDENSMKKRISKDNLAYKTKFIKPENNWFNPNEHVGIDKYPKTKNNGPQNSIIDDIPVKDNPLAASFKPPQRKPKKKKPTGAFASITSMSVEPKMDDPSNKNLWRPQDGGPKLSHYQSNLRFVFPMRGILMFCGILGALAVVTIVILVIYGAVKCKRTPTKGSCYQLTESQDLTSLSGSSIKSESEKMI